MDKTLVQQRIGNIKFKKFKLKQKDVDDAWNFLTTQGDDVVATIRASLDDADTVRLLGRRLFTFNDVQQQMMDMSDAEMMKVVDGLKDPTIDWSDYPLMRRKRVKFVQEVTFNSPATVTCRFGFW